jgi:cell division topological specificity factor
MKVFRKFRTDNSAQKAKERLQLVLVHDRADISPARLEELKDELILVLSKYVQIDRDATNISLTRDRNEQRLVADIPLTSPRGRR